MPRLRTIKHDFAFDREMAMLPLETQKFFILLWTHSDRAGRGEDDPQRLRALIFPYHPKVDAEKIMASLHPKFLFRYKDNGRALYQIRTWDKHQRPHNREPQSEINPPDPDSYNGNGNGNGNEYGNGVSQPKHGQGTAKARPCVNQSRFIKPSLKEVQDYCGKRGNTVSPQAFLDYYDSNGWKVGGKAPMKDWRASVRTWEARDHGTGKGGRIVGHAKPTKGKFDHL